MQSVDLISTATNFSWADYSVFGTMLVISSMFGFYFGFKDYYNRRSKQKIDVSTEDTDGLNYLVGNREMHAFPVGFSLIATWISALALLGTSSETYIFGAEYSIMIVGTIVLGLAMHYIFLPIYYELKITSTHVYLQKRFNKSVQILGSVMFTTQLILWMPPVIYVPTLALYTVTGIDELTTSIVLVAVCVFYTFLGGMKAVIWSDVFQITTTIAVYVVITVVGTIKVGGISVVYDRNLAGERFSSPNISADPTIRHSVFSLIIGGSFFWLVTNCGNQNMIQRYLSLPTLKSTRIALWIYIAGVISFIGVSCYLGLLMFANYYECDPLTTGLIKSRDSLLPLFVTDLFGEYNGFTGFFVAGLFASSLSSLSTGLNSLSAVVVEDFVKVFIKRKISSLALQIWMRSVVIIFGVISIAGILIVRQVDGVMQLAMSISSCTLGPLLGIFVMGIGMPWINSKSAFFGGLLSFALMLANGINTQLAIIRKDVVYQPKPLSVTNCSYIWDTNESNSIPTEFYISGPHISYIYYGFFGVISCCLIGNLACLMFGTNEIKLVDPILLAPFIRKMLKSKT